MYKRQVIALPNDPSVSLHENFGFTEDYLMTNAGYKDGHWYDVGFWRLKLSDASENILPIKSIDELKSKRCFKNSVVFGEQFLKLS